MRPAGQTTTPLPIAEHTVANSVRQESTVPTDEEGPWIASCRYWSPAREWKREASGKRATVNLSIQGEAFNVASTASAGEESAADDGCSIPDAQDAPRGSSQHSVKHGNEDVLLVKRARWGIPIGRPDNLKPKIHLLIAAVHDPVHSHLAMDFDREVDALVQAAGDNGYVPSYYWLPWKRQSGLSRAGRVNGSEDVEEDARKDRQPGLIIFKYVPKINNDKVTIDPWDSFTNVIYVFLVGQTPTLGVDGSQLKNAFHYEAELAQWAQTSDGSSKSPFDLSFSMKKGNRLDIIGATSSGAATSTREAIEIGRNEVGTAAQKTLVVKVAGETSTELAGDVLTDNRSDGTLNHSSVDNISPTYLSFGDNTTYDSELIRELLSRAGYRPDEEAILFEDSTTYGNAGYNSNVLDNSDGLAAVIIRFPREISLLRNAHVENEDIQDGSEGSVPSPFLPFSLRDPGAEDSVPHFSTEHTPLSQEAQLMAIGRQLVRNRVKFILIVASDVLDQLFLAQFLHRACPDARLVFLGSDLLYERETQNAPFVGAIALTPYGLTSLAGSQTKGKPVRAFADSHTAAFYNATSYILSDDRKEPLLANYSNPFDPTGRQHPLLWATTIGRDGYYPLAIVSDCPEMFPDIHPSSIAADVCPQPILPAITNAAGGPLHASEKTPQTLQSSANHDDTRPFRYPALSWYALCIVITMVCVVHSFAVTFPHYWSSATRDLAIPQGDKRHLRAMYIQIGSCMLFCMAFVIAYPLFPTFRVIHPNWSTAIYSMVTILSAFASLSLTLRKTWKFLTWHDVDVHILPGRSAWQILRIKFNKNLPWFFNKFAFLALLVVVVVWIVICNTEEIHGVSTHVGVFFSYRCLHPGSGVSPVVPILFVLLGWYIWAVFQTLRLRFSTKNRPQLPGPLQGTGPYPIYVSDIDLAQRSGTTDRCLFDNITCLLITRNWLKRIIERPALRHWEPFSPGESEGGVLTPWFFLFYLCLYFLVVFVNRVESLDRILWNSGWSPTPYEWLLSTLFYPLIMIAVAGWLRIVLVWGSLRRGLLQRLEQYPIRYAFNRLKGTGWIAMMRQGGLAEQWQDMARSNESIHQMCNDKGFLAKVEEPFANRMTDIRDGLDKEIGDLLKELPPEELHSTPKNLYFQDDPSVPPEKYEEYSRFWAKGRIGAPGDLPLHRSEEQGKDADQSGLDHMFTIEKYYAAFCEALLGGILLNHWTNKRAGFVASDDAEEMMINVHSESEIDRNKALPTSSQLQIGAESEESRYIQVAEEFLAIRYLSLIRAVLVNIRYLITFVSAVFVLTIVAWNSYPFQPRQWVNEAFTGLLFLLGIGIIWVFAQIHRDPILSRVTNTNANELGLDFYLRVAMFGAIPVLTWLAYQFPEVGGKLFRLIQPGLEVLK